MNKQLNNPFVIGPLLLSLFFTSAAAQQKDTDSLRLIREYMTMQAALRYPVLRRAWVQVESVGDMHYTSRLHGRDFLEGTVQPRSVVRGFFSVPLYSSGKQEISATLGYLRQELVLKNTIDKIPQSPVQDGAYTFQNLSLFLNYRRTDTLFGKPILWGGTLILNSSLQFPLDQAIGLLYGIFPVKTAPRTRISVGLLVITDPASLTPVIPTFSYWHKFTASPWEISVDLPTRVLLRRSIFSKGLLSLGTELSDNTQFKKTDLPFLPAKAQFKETDLKTGFTIEYPILKKVLIGCNGGMQNKVVDKILKKNTSLNDYDISSKRNPGPYFNISISIL